MSQTDDIITTPQNFAAYASELLDSEVTKAMEIIVSIQRKYANRPNTVENLEALREEALHRLANIGILATLDPAPCLYGEPPILEILGKITTDQIHTYGVDHEQKSYEVRKAHSRGEYYLGEKERVNSRKVVDKTTKPKTA